MSARIRQGDGTKRRTSRGYRRLRGGSGYWGVVVKTVSPCGRFAVVYRPSHPNSTLTVHVSELFPYTDRHG